MGNDATVTSGEWIPLWMLDQRWCAAGRALVSRRRDAPGVNRAGSGKGFDRAHHAVVLVQQDVAVVNPPARKVEKPRAHGDLAEWRHGRRVLPIAHRNRLPVHGD